MPTITDPVTVSYRQLSRIRELGELGDCEAAFKLLADTMHQALADAPPLCHVCGLRPRKGTPGGWSWGCVPCLQTTTQVADAAKTRFVDAYPELGWRYARMLRGLLPDLRPEDRPTDPLAHLVGLVETATDEDLLALRNFGVRSLKALRFAIPHREPSDAALSF